MNFYKNVDILKVFETYKYNDKCYSNYENHLFKYISKNNLNEDFWIDEFIDDDITYSIKDFYPEGFSLDFYTTIEQMTLLGNFFVDIGFAKSDFEDYYNKYYTFCNFLDKENFSELDEITVSFKYLIDKIEDTDLDFKERLIKELELLKEYKYFENDEFIYIPDYAEFENMDILGEIPNFIHKPTGYVIRFRKGVSRSAFTNVNINYGEFDKILYSCRLSMV